ncbi:MAG: hypothetical protein H6843_13465 [Rhodospirillaceae bacterium]|nr:hypothetical protein [Rhodospirillaceae bacterium]
MSEEWLESLRSLRNRLPNKQEFEFLKRELGNADSDRTVALIAGAILEVGLRNFLESKRDLFDSALRKKLFPPKARSPRFAELISTAGDYGFIDSHIQDDCDCIREIRNTFAHSIVSISFKTEEIRVACKRLTKPYPDKVYQDIDSERLRYLTCIGVIGWHLERGTNLPNTKYPLTYSLT